MSAAEDTENIINEKMSFNESFEGTKIGLVAYNSENRSGTQHLTPEELQSILQEMSEIGMNFDLSTQITLIIVFTLLILFGAAGNGLVCYVVARNPHMRTPRNIFIINLAISDLTLCLFTQPFNLMKVSMRKWLLGNFMCKFVPMSAGTNVFVSTISITAIALDRFQVIVYPTKDNTKKVGAVLALLSIWTISLLMASPMLIFNILQPVEPWEGYVLYEVCVENSGLHFERGAYSVVSMIFQYFVPIIIVTVAHARICNKLRYRMANQRQNNVQTMSHSPFLLKKKVAESKRKRKTNLLLIMIAVVFACSWMPLNVFNIFADVDHNTFQDLDKKGLVFPICHLLVLSSACTNPVLYGWLNENFRKEFLRVFNCVLARGSNDSNNGGGHHKSRNGDVNKRIEIRLNAADADNKDATPDLEDFPARKNMHNLTASTDNSFDYSANNDGASINGQITELDVGNITTSLSGGLSVNTSFSMTSIN